MKNYDYWKNFVTTGNINDYLNYIACTNEEYSEEIVLAEDIPGLNKSITKKGISTKKLDATIYNSGSQSIN